MIMKLDKDLLDQITHKAKESPRLRMNHNLHDSLDSKVQRLFNALEPGTVLPIHRHQNTDETYILVRGKIEVIFYDDDKNMTDIFVICQEEGTFGVHIPKGTWHTLEVLASGSVIFEVKEGPYQPISENDIL